LYFNIFYQLVNSAFPGFTEDNTSQKELSTNGATREVNIYL